MSLFFLPILLASPQPISSAVHAVAKWGRGEEGRSPALHSKIVYKSPPPPPTKPKPTLEGRIILFFPPLLIFTSIVQRRKTDSNRGRREGGSGGVICVDHKIGKNLPFSHSPERLLPPLAISEKNTKKDKLRRD